MQVFRALVKNAALNPPAASRVYAYAGIALYESQARSTKQTSTLVGQLNGLTGLTAPPSEALDSQMVVNETLYTLAKGLFPKGVSVNPALLTTFYEQKRARLQSSLETALFTRSQSYGAKLGQDLVKWSLTDQVQELREKSYLLPSRSGHPEYWQPTESNTTAVEPHWGKMRPFAIATAQTCQEPLPLSFSTEAGSAFYQQGQAVLSQKAKLTPEQKAIAWWWADGAGTATPAGHWVAIVGQIAQAKQLNGLETAKGYALTGIALADAFIGCWDLKYQVNLLRPETYIQEFMGQSFWKPLVKTPPFPEYPSGHSVSSAAVAEVLTALWGEQSFVDTSNQDQGYAPRSYSNFKVAAEEAAISRLYGGIHFPAAIEAGLKQGRCVGQKLMQRIKL
ncbi:MAG: vanadium-dependent haloperoxidase [Candidatus Sericytochromatia bacterium]